jgi:hypothetical protein
VIQEVAKPTSGSVRAYARHRRALGLPGGTHQSVRKAIERQRIAVASDGVIDFAEADKQWESNTMHAKGPALRTGGSSGNPTDDITIPIDRLSLFSDFVNDEPIIVLGVGNVPMDQKVDLDTSWCIPMTPEVARLVGSKLLLLAHQAGEDISFLFACPDARAEAIRRHLEARCVLLATD